MTKVVYVRNKMYKSETVHTTIRRMTQGGMKMKNKIMKQYKKQEIADYKVAQVGGVKGDPPS